ncbi:protease inhibitor I42 family protein [Luteipulveratus halotolerans]|uniref:Proteinase inhibitor I42 chagasin domain-containing protein n=1 Tax=Luteipulveratus halotolerans TaxID=1631356 RepID=A0A0L6CMC0_9MICO|nr:protease inhibitor I42 family protein [Luteipulveratus halotolerans]KNX38879.1 hypothetical protein VV01_19860 [Luteipulveratus halotolerans]
MHHVVESPEDGQRIEMSPGDSLELRLDQPGATGFRWTTQAVPPGVVAHRAGAEPSGEAGVGGPPGAARTTVIELVASAAGEGELTLALARPWEDEPARTLTVTLAVG